MKAAKLNHREFIHQGRVFNVFKDNVTLKNGTTIDLDIIRHPGASAMVAMTEHKEIILLKQYRYAVDDYIWEIPAGTLNPNEPPIECAKRELIEEAGVSAENWEKLGEITPLPGYSDERIHIFLASGLKEAEQNLDDDEILNVHRIQFQDAVTMIYSGRIIDAKSISGIFMAKDRLG